MKATARAHANIALTKYWGKRDANLMLPQNSSVSMTLDKYHATTTVEFKKGLQHDTLRLNGKRATAVETAGLKKPLDKVRKRAGIKEYARVVSVNNFPTAAGLASSAAGYAALAAAASRAAGLWLGKRQLSMLARLGSGSATRSIHGGFVEWRRGKKRDGSDSYALQIAKPQYWDVRMLTTVVETGRKKTASRAGMSQTVKTSPLYSGWLATAEEDSQEMKKAVRARNFKAMGRIAEHNCLKMHATMIATQPPIIYWQPATLEIMHAVQRWRQEGIACYFTIDAGPNVKVLCQPRHQEKLKRRLKWLAGVKEVHACKPGPDAHELTQHLF